jgi:hypothetical protein
MTQPLHVDSIASRAVGLPNRPFSEAENEKRRKKLEKTNTVCKKTEGGVTSAQWLLIWRGRISFWNLSNTFKAARSMVLPM